MLSVQMIRLDELRGMLHQRRLATDARDVETGVALTETIDELDAQVTDAKIAQEAKVSAWMATIQPASFAC